MALMEQGSGRPEVLEGIAVNEMLIRPTERQR
jgi:hypothetical protein